MSKRIAIVAGFALIAASPALADCKQELTALEQKVVHATTGASTSESGMPATKHQEEALAGKQETTGSTAAPVEPTSPHQEQVVRKLKSDEQATQLMAEARQMSEAGNEQECMKKVTELKDVLGAK